MHIETFITGNQMVFPKKNKASRYNQLSARTHYFPEPAFGSCFLSRRLPVSVNWNGTK